MSEADLTQQLHEANSSLAKEKARAAELEKAGERRAQQRVREANKAAREAQAEARAEREKREWAGELGKVQEVIEMVLGKSGDERQKRVMACMFGEFAAGVVEERIGRLEARCRRVRRKYVKSRREVKELLETAIEALEGKDEEKKKRLFKRRIELIEEGNKEVMGEEDDEECRLKVDRSGCESVQQLCRYLENGLEEHELEENILESIG